MYWQTCIKKNVVNGYSGFFPKNRIEMNEALHDFKNDNKSLKSYLKKHNIKHIIYYGRDWGLTDCPVDMETVRGIAKEENIDLVMR